MGKLTAPVIQPCPACATLQELPAIFCWQCGGPLLKVSKWFITFFLMVTAAAYGIYGLYSDTLIWPIPLYLYYVLIFISLSLIITRRHRWISVRVTLWSFLLLYAMTFVGLSANKFIDYIVTDFAEIAHVIRRSYFSIGIAGGMLLFALLLGSIALTRRFRFTLAYRIFLTFLAALAYAGARFLEAPDIGEPRKMSSLALWLPDETISAFLDISAINLLRVLAAEMVVYSVVTSFASATEAFARLARKLFPPQGSSTQQPAFLQTTYPIIHALVRAGVHIQHFFITLGKTLTNYAWCMYRVIRRLMLDFIIPITMLAITSFLLAVVSEHTAAYLHGRAIRPLVYIPGIRSPLVMIGISVIGVFIAQMVFLATVAKFRLADLWRCNTLLALWIGPFAFAVFVFISISLVATGTVLRHWGNDSFPYHIGPLTVAAGVALLVMFAFALLYPQWAKKGFKVMAQSGMLLPEPGMETEHEKRSLPL